MDTIYTEPGYTLSAEVRGRELHLAVKTPRGEESWTAAPRITGVPRGLERRLPSGFRGFWVGYPVREGARSVVALLVEERDAAIRAEIEREARLLREACPGIDELREALADHERYHDEFERMMEDEGNDGVRPPRPARGDVEALRERHPRAAAYLTLECWSRASHHVKSAAGRRGTERVLAGDDAQAVLAEAEREWSGWCASHVD